MWKNKGRIIAFKVKVTVKGQNVSDCPDIFYTAKHFVTKLDIVMPHCEPDCMLFSRLRSQQGLVWPNFDSFYYIFWTADPFATRLGLIKRYHKPKCLMEKWDVVFKVKVTAKFHNVNECLSRWYHLNRWTFYNHTWYGDASLLARLSSKKIDLLFSRSRLLQELIWSKYDNFYCIFWIADPFATKLGLIILMVS